jgi:predicted nucleic acid-binding protein
MVLETALNGRANAIVTFNRRHFLVVTKQFGIVVLSPAAMMNQTEKRS